MPVLCGSGASLFHLLLNRYINFSFPPFLGSVNSLNMYLYPPPRLPWLDISPNCLCLLNPPVFRVI